MQTGRLFIRFFVQVEGNLVNRFFFFFVVGRVKITVAICWTAVVDGERGEVGGNETVSAAETSRVDCQLRERERSASEEGRKKEENVTDAQRAPPAPYAHAQSPRSLASAAAAASAPLFSVCFLVRGAFPSFLDAPRL